MLDGIGYAVREIRDHWRDTDWWRQRVLRWANGEFQARVYPGRHGVDVPAADWDTLVVLDACRADCFDQVVDADRFDAYRHETSRASATAEWLRVNFAGDHPDVVYVAGNPMVSLQTPGSFHRLVEVWRDGFDESLRTIAADAVTEVALDAHESHPDKRHVVHYMQPHVPFVGHPELQFTGLMDVPEIAMEDDPRVGNVWGAADAGLVEREALWEGYRDNLAYVIDEVWRLVDAVDGRVVVTSDHGNVVGRWSYPIPFRISGHPPHHRDPRLVTVPWGVIDGERRRVREGEATSASEADDEVVADRLRHLGYHDA